MVLFFGEKAAARIFSHSLELVARCLSPAVVVGIRGGMATIAALLLLAAIVSLSSVGCSEQASEQTTPPGSDSASPVIAADNSPPTVASGSPETPLVAQDATPKHQDADAQLATKTFREMIRRARPLIDNFKALDTGRWSVVRYLTRYDSPTATMDSRTDRTILGLTCIDADQQTDYLVLEVVIVREDSDWVGTYAVFYFLDEHGTELKSFTRVVGPRGPEPYVRPESVVDFWLREAAQEVIDGMLLEGVSSLTIEFPDGSSSTFPVAGIATVNELLTSHCEQTADESLAAVAADVLKAPTPTPTSPPTSTPAPQTTWQQEWCKERDNRPFEKEGLWYKGGSGGSGVRTARLIMRCTGGTLVAGVHIIQSDGRYPENRTGVAIAALVNDKIKPYQYYPDGWQQMSGETGGGRFIIFPDHALREVIGLIDRERYGGAERLGFWVLFDALPNPQPNTKQYDQSLGPDIVVPIRSNLRHTFIPLGIPTAVPTPTPQPTPTPTAPPPPRPQPVNQPLTAKFIGVPPSHDGEDAIGFRLQFTEPVSTSYKTLRDVAIRAENGTVLESKRVDKRSDLWMITVEPEGEEDMVITLTTPVDCANTAAVCTERGKALANTPMVLVRYQR